jgi:hypothetical protein
MDGKVMKLLLEREGKLLGEIFGLATIKVGGIKGRGCDLGEEIGFYGHVLLGF